MRCKNTSWVKCVGEVKLCTKCNTICIKYGFTFNGKQRYFCKNCKLSVVKNYSYNGYNSFLNKKVIALTKEGVGIRSIARLLSVSKQTVTTRIIKISKAIKKPAMVTNQVYEVDELRTYVGNKKNLKWLVVAVNKYTRQIVEIAIGSRTNTTLKKVTDTLLLGKALKIFTDKLKNYTSLIPSVIHSTKYKGTNSVERINLNFRTHLKRLSRKTICFSKNNKMLLACVLIYCWG